MKDIDEFQEKIFFPNKDIIKIKDEDVAKILDTTSKTEKTNENDATIDKPKLKKLKDIKEENYKILHSGNIDSTIKDNSVTSTVNESIPSFLNEKEHIKDVDEIVDSSNLDSTINKISSPLTISAKDKELLKDFVDLYSFKTKENSIEDFELNVIHIFYKVIDIVEQKISMKDYVPPTLYKIYFFAKDIIEKEGK